MSRDEAGSALMLMPAAVLVVIVLAAIAVDSAVLFLGERELAAATAAAANDAATGALDVRSFYGCDGLALDRHAAQELAQASLAARASDAVHVTGLDVAVDASGVQPRVSVAATGTVDLIFSPAVPGGRAHGIVDAVSVAHPQPAGPAVVEAC